MEADTP